MKKPKMPKKFEKRHIINFVTRVLLNPHIVEDSKKMLKESYDENKLKMVKDEKISKEDFLDMIEMGLDGRTIKEVRISILKLYLRDSGQLQ